MAGNRLKEKRVHKEKTKHRKESPLYMQRFLNQQLSNQNMYNKATHVQQDLNQLGDIRADSLLRSSCFGGDSALYCREWDLENGNRDTL